MTMLAALAFCVAAFAQGAPQQLVTWSSHIEKADAEDVYRVIFTGKIADGYHTYTLTDEFSATEFMDVEVTGGELVGGPYEISTPTEEVDEFGDMAKHYYNEIIVAQDVKLTEATGKLAGTLFTNTCTSGTCKAEYYDFEVSVDPAYAVMPIAEEAVEEVKQIAEKYEALFNAEFAPIEEGITLRVESVEVPETVVPEEIQDNLIDVILACHNGVLRFIPTIPDTVETSSNLASVRMADGEVKIVLSQRSSTASGKKDVADSVRAVFELAGAEVEVGEGYPGWKPNAKSEILQVAKATYQQLFGKEPKVKAIHAGLECGLFLEKYPHLDMISFGPTMRGVHSPDERLLIPTVELWWKHLVAVLEAAPVK